MRVVKHALEAAVKTMNVILQGIGRVMALPIHNKDVWEKVFRNLLKLNTPTFGKGNNSEDYTFRVFFV